MIINLLEWRYLVLWIISRTLREEERQSREVKEGRWHSVQVLALTLTAYFGNEFLR